MLDLKQNIELWLMLGSCGAMVYGRPRVGKTFCISYLVKYLVEDLKNEEAVVVWNVTDHPDTEKNFYSSLLMAMGLSVRPRQTALLLKEQVLNELTIRASETNQRRVVLFLDEASLFHEKDFSWLMDLYNNLMLKDIQLTSFLFGTRELKDLKTSLKKRSKDQIIGRFMVHENQYFGIRNIEELNFCLISLEQKHVRGVAGEPLKESFSEFFFPNGGSFSDIAEDFWEAFQKIREKHDIVAEDIPMKYFMDSFSLCLALYGRGGIKETAFPTRNNLVECVELSGYRESDDEYEKQKTA